MDKEYVVTRYKVSEEDLWKSMFALVFTNKYTIRKDDEWHRMGRSFYPKGHEESGEEIHFDLVNNGVSIRGSNEQIDKMREDMSRNARVELREKSRKNWLEDISDFVEGCSILVD
ncbi:hypothetical protein J4225_03800 [Candidatus Pacearchaeota archaeon]|nr:hypothetical protein [Candidatus Pacearchaeota archaeon]